MRCPDGSDDGEFVDRGGTHDLVHGSANLVFLSPDGVRRKMAARLANQGGARCVERQEAGPCQSYASVVNPKGASQTRAISFKSNNKENIDDQVTVSQQQQQHSQQQQQQQRQATTGTKEKIVPSVKGGKSYQVTRCPQTGEKRERHESPPSMPVAQLDVVRESSTSATTAVPGVSRQEDERLSGSGVANDGEFQTVATKGARRKEKMREQYRDSHRERHRLRESNNRHQPPRGASGVGGGGVARRGSDERSHRERADRNGVLDHGPKEAHHHKDEQSVEAEAQPAASPHPVKYVEAPLPAVNPWMRNRTSASAQTAKTLPLQQQQPQPPQPPQPQPQPQPPNVLTASTCDKQSERERRVLQPQQQQQQLGATGESRFFKIRLAI